MSFHTDAIQKEALISSSQNIYIPEGTSVAFLQIHKREVWKFLGFLFLLCLSPQFFCNRSSTIRQTQRKISSIAKLPSTELSNSFLQPRTMLAKISIVLLQKNSLPDLFLQNSICFFSKLPFQDCLVFSFTLLNRHFIIAAPTKIITRSRHPDSMPIQCSRHRSSTKVLPMQM